MKDVVLGPGPKGRRSSSPYETFGESDDEEGSGNGEEDADVFGGIKPTKLDFGIKVGEVSARRGDKGPRGGTDELSRPNIAPQVKH